MLKIAATGNLTNDVELKTQEAGRPYAILRIASDRRYRAKDGTRLTDFISIKVRGPLAERCAAMAYKGCKLAAAGDFETVVPSEDPTRQPGFLIKASDVEMREDLPTPDFNYAYRKRAKKKKNRGERA